MTVAWGEGEGATEGEREGEGERERQRDREAEGGGDVYMLTERVGCHTCSSSSHHN